MSFPPYETYKDSGVEWLGDVPRHWRTGKIRQFAKLESGHTPSRQHPEWWENCTIPWFSLGDVWQIREGRATYVYETKELVSELGLANSSARLLPKGTVILSRTASVGFSAIMGCDMATTQDFANWVCGPDLIPEFLLMTLRAMKGEFDRLMMGSTHQTIYMPDIAKLALALPPRNEQSAIISFLDRETAKIDALVEEQQRLIALLEEKRQAVISHAVTKGLDPNAPMKGSGVEWLGEVPAHWDVLPLSRVTIDKCDGPFGSGLKSEHYTDEGVRVVRLQNIRENGFDGTDAAFIGEAYYRDSLGGHDVVSGDVLIAGLGDEKNTVGRACVAPIGIEPAMVKADCFRFRVNSSVALPRFVATELSVGSAFDAGILSSGSTRSRIPLSTMATRKLALPSLSEQSVILNLIESATRRLDALLVEAKSAIALLQERRSALISAAVTGKIDVRGLAPQSAEAA
ncbi:hypothetical protein A1351_21570 [Methylosinus sp. R-45379]|uniref:restriction endonuclease subunit S n=1 Tax=Methylosinus sp. R-45379 TaxID=980563 RepID=UPI0007C92153|nr:restriction endonuclease subunit S [Methylosinus sp. R-45379]OAI31474.1 hypothetical protein A1351_21570 [Methylosinus sp. R-45379]